MSRSGGMSQLFKGIIIGIVLILAIIGTMSMLGIKGPFESNPTQATPTPTTASTSNTNTSISSPSITLKPEANQNSNIENNSDKIGDLNAALTDETNTQKPHIEEEPQVAPKQETVPTVFYGMMALNAINPNNSQAIKTNFTVFDSSNTKVAQSNDATKTAFRLPTGQYKVEATLTRIDEATQQVIPVSTKSRYMIVRTNSTSRQTFEIEPPATTGVLQVSAKLNNQLIRANFIIQKNNGEVIASRNNVSNSLFKLKTGTYKVTVTNGSNRDFRSVEVKAGESTQTVFLLKNAAQQGRLLLRVFDKNSSNAVRADISIAREDGTEIQNISSATKTELSLAPGRYKLTVVGSTETKSRFVTIKPNQVLNEIVRLAAAEHIAEQTTPPDTQSTQNTQGNSAEESQAPTTGTSQSDSDMGVLNLSAIDAESQKPLRSNFYIQTMTGKHLDKKIYANNAEFNLPTGVYKVTIRSKNRDKQVKTIRIEAGGAIKEIISLVKPQNQTTNKNTQATESAPVTKPSNVATGFVNVVMQGRTNRQSHFIVTSQAGQKIVELSDVEKGNFKLDVGNYVITVINNNKRKDQRVAVRANQNTRLTFNTSDFATAGGILRSRIIDEAGRPLKGNLIVRNMAGKIVGRANDVSTASFNLPPVKHIIIVQIQGLTGEEVIKIHADETTVQTFTIASGNGSQ